jgi:hypothetical protein
MNTLLTSDVIAKESARAFVNSLQLASGIDMQYKNEFAKVGGKIGATVNVRKPIRFVVNTGQALALQDVQDETSPLTIQYQDHVDFQFSSADLALTVDAFSERYLKPAGAALATKFDTRVAELYKKVFNYVGVPGTTTATALEIAAARTALNLSGCPDEGKRRMVVTSKQNATIVDQLKGLQHSGPEIAKQYAKGVMARAYGFDWSEDDNLIAHTCGTLLGTPLVKGAGQTGTSLISDAWTGANTLTEGDVIQIAGVYSVNPISYKSTGVLQNFVITANVAAAGGEMTCAIYPPMIATGPLQTISALPADNAAITTWGTAAGTYASKVALQSLAFHPKAFTAAFVDLQMPRGADMASTISDDELGISMRVWRDGNISTDQFPCRIDILYGLTSLRPEWAVRVQS